MRKQFIQNLIVGIFTFAVLIWGMYTIYQTSEESTILLNKIQLRTHMTNANGIKYYSPVRVHGISVGKVESVKFSEDPGEDLIFVKMSVNSDYVGRIAIGNPDPQGPVNDPDGIFAYLYISSEGLLGDNLLDIYAGDPNRAAEQAKKYVRAWAARNVRKSWEEADKEWDELEARPEIEREYDELLMNVPNLEKGYIEDGMYLPTKPGGGGLAAITESLDPTLARVNDLLDAAKTEPGLLNTLFYDPKGKDLLHHIDGVVVEVQGLFTDVRQGPGGLHEVIYGSQLKDVLDDVQGVIASVEERDLVGNIKGTLANVEDITRKINEGEGTLGALVTDKSLYEDLQELLGGAKRSVVIKQAVRYVKSRNRKEEAEQPSGKPTGPSAEQ